MNKVSKILATSAVTLATLLVTPVDVFAQDIHLNLPANSMWANVSNLTPGSVVSGLIRLILVIAAILFFFMLVIGGIQWIISGGDKAGSENARKRITSALVGLAIVFAAWAIINLVNILFGIDIMGLNIPSLVDGNLR